MQVIDEHKDMQSAMGSLVDVKQKYNEQELEDELADLLSNDKPNAGKHLIPGSVLVANNNVSTLLLFEQQILQTSRMYRITVWKARNWNSTGDSSC